MQPLHWNYHQQPLLTSITADGLSSPEEAKISSPGVGGAHIAATDQSEEKLSYLCTELS